MVVRTSGLFRTSLPEASAEATGGPTTKRALITGVGGQDGSLLAELLVDEGYEVCGVVRDASVAYENLADLTGQIEVVEANVLDQESLTLTLEQCRPHEVYNLASPSFVPLSWEKSDHDGGVRRGRRDDDARGNPRGGHDDSLLPGVVERDLRRAA